MSASDVTNGPSPVSEPSPNSASLDVLRHFAAMGGVSLFEPRALELLGGASAELAPGVAPEERLDALAAVGQALGLKATLVRVRPQEAMEVLTGGQELVASLTGHEGWWLFKGLDDQRIEAIHVVEGERTERRVLDEAAALGELLGVGETSTVTWLTTEAPGLRREVIPPDAHSPTLTPFERLRAIMRPDRGDVVAVVIFAVTIGILGLATPIAVQAIVNSVAQGGLFQQLIVVVLALAGALLFLAALVATQTWIVELIQRRIFVRTLADVASRLPRVAAKAYDGGHGPELVNRIFDVVTVQKSAAKLLLDALSLALSVVVGLSVLAFYHPLLLAFDVVLLAAIALTVFGPLRRGERTAVDESDAKYKVAAWLEEIARNPNAFRTGGADQWVFERTDAVARGWLESRRAHFKVLFGQISSALVLQVLASTALLGLGSLLVIQGSLNLGQLVAAELIVTTVVVSVAKMGKHLETWYDIIAATKKVGQLLDVDLEVGGAEALSVGSRSAGPMSLEIRNVSWSDEAGRQRLEGVSVSVEAGQRLAVCGPPGAAKSILLDMLWGLREPSHGVIRIDGADIRDLSFESLRRDVGLVTRVEVVVGTVRENVSLYRPFVSIDDVRSALEMVGLDEVVDALPQGLDTPIHPSTRLLDDSELRRLMVARAIAGSPRLLVVGSLFADFRGAGGRRMRDSLFDPGAGWTLLVVTEDDEALGQCSETLELGPGAALLAGEEAS